jgi:pyrimidine-nucleoside phosphorylase
MSTRAGKTFPAFDGSASDAELMAVIDCFRTRTASGPDDAARLAECLAGTNRTLFPGACVADVASTGGPTSLSTIISPLFLRAAGATVPKLGVPGRPAGGIDCLAQIPGYAFKLSQVREAIDRVGYAHFLAGNEIAPLDARMFALRQSVGAQAVPELVTASLLAKKVAVGVQYVGLDIRVGRHGNFGADREAATRNATLFAETARRLGIQAAPVLTNGMYPYQEYIGRRESLVALSDLFEGCASPWLLEHFATCKTLAMCCLPDSRRGGADDATPADLRNHFLANLEAQGAIEGGFETIVEKTRELHAHELHAASDGFCAFDLSALRNAMVGWQRDEGAVNHCAFPDPVGVILRRRPGEWVRRGACVATFRAPDDRYRAVVDVLTRILATPTPRAENSNCTMVYG